MHRLLSRVLDALLLLWLVTTITFALIHLAPGDPATLLISPTASADEAARQRTALGLDAPLPMQYARWLGGVLRGDLGESLVRAEPVTRVITEALPVSLFLGGVSLLASFVLGALAGWRGGLVDRAIVAVGDALLAIPRLVLLLVIASLWGPGLGVVITVLGLTGWMSVMRLVRADVQSVRELAYVEGAHALGVPSWRVLRRHVLPNAMGSALVAITLGIGNAILLESGLSFLGLGIQPPSSSWGNMIAGGREWLLVAPWIALVPGVALVITVVACTVLGDALGHHDARRGLP